MAMTMELPNPLPPDENRGSSLLTLLYVPIAVATIMLGARVFVRAHMRQLGRDDYFMLASYVSWIISTATATVYILNGGCRHVFYLDLPTIQLLLEYVYITSAIGTITPVLGKLSIAFLMMRIMGRAASWRKWIFYAVMGIYIVMSLLTVIFTFAQCNPSRALWDLSIPRDHCWPEHVYLNFSMAQSALGAFIDFALALVPVGVLWNLNMALSKKISLAVLLGLGVLAGVCAVVKIVYLSEYTGSLDITWDTYVVFMWAEAEVALVVICGTIPVLKPLWDYMLKGRTFSYWRASTRYSQKGSQSFPRDPPTGTFSSYKEAELLSSSSETERSLSLQRPLEVHYTRAVEIDSVPMYPGRIL